MSRSIEALLVEARAARRAGRADEARETYDRTRLAARDAGRPLLEGDALRHLSDLDREAARREQALSAAEQAVTLYETADRPLDLANSLRLKALALEGLMSRTDARPAWIRARDLYAAAAVADGVAECEERLRRWSPAPGP